MRTYPFLMFFDFDVYSNALKCCPLIFPMACRRGLKRFFFRSGLVRAVPMQYLLKPNGFMRSSLRSDNIGDGTSPSRFSSMMAISGSSISRSLIRLWKRSPVSIVSRSVLLLLTRVIRLNLFSIASCKSSGL